MTLKSRWLPDFLPVGLWMGLIFTLSAQPTLVQIDQPLMAILFFKTAHVVVYAILAGLWWRVLTKQRSATWPILLAAFSLTVGYGITDEIHQLYVPGRHGRFADVLFDASGALAMILLIRLYAIRVTGEKHASRITRIQTTNL